MHCIYLASLVVRFLWVAIGPSSHIATPTNQPQTSAIILMLKCTLDTLSYRLEISNVR